jgi:hypothetical protein
MTTFNINDKVNIFWGDSYVTTSTGTIDKVTPKFIHLNQGVIRSQWIPRHLIRQATINGVTTGNANKASYM